MSKEDGKYFGNIGKIAKICLVLAAVLILIGLGVGATRAYQARQERNELAAINNEIDNQGVSAKAKSLISSFMSKYPQAKNIIVADNDCKIVHSANKQVIGDRTDFILQPDTRSYGVFNLKDSPIKFITNPRSVVPFAEQPTDRNINPNVNNQNNTINDTRPFGMRDGIRENRLDGFNRGRKDERFGENSFDYRMGSGMMQNGMRRGEFVPNDHISMNNQKNPNMLFLNSYKSDTKGLNVFYIGQGFMQNKLMVVLAVIGGLLRLLGLVLWVLLAAWVYRDSKSRGLNPILWGILTIFTGLVGLVIYLAAKHFVTFCQVCGQKVRKDADYCTECGAIVRLKCASCGESVGLDSNYCHKCGAKQEKE